MPFLPHFASEQNPTYVQPANNLVCNRLEDFAIFQDFGSAWIVFLPYRLICSSVDKPQQSVVPLCRQVLIDKVSKCIINVTWKTYP